MSTAVSVPLRMEQRDPRQPRCSDEALPSPFMYSTLLIFFFKHTVPYSALNSWRFFEALLEPLFAVPPTTSWAWCGCEPEIDTKLWNPFDLWRFYVRSVKTILHMPQDARTFLLFSCFSPASFLATYRSSHVALQMVNSSDWQFWKQSELFHGLLENRERLDLCFLAVSVQAGHSSWRS